MMKNPTRTFLLFLSLYSVSSSAQFSTVWTAPYQHTLAAGFSNEGRKITEDPAGNVFILSDHTSDIDPNGVQGAATYHYVTVLKYSPNGVLLNSVIVEVFDHQVSGYNNPGAFGLDIDGAGDVYVGYTTYDAITGFDIGLGKYDNNLQRIWTNIYGTAGAEKGLDFKVDASGTIYALIKSTDAQVVYSLIKSVPFSAPSILVYAFPPNSV